MIVYKDELEDLGMQLLLLVLPPAGLLARPPSQPEAHDLFGMCAATDHHHGTGSIGIMRPLLYAYSGGQPRVRATTACLLAL